MQKSIIFVIKKLKINIWKIKKSWSSLSLTEEYRGAAHSIWNLKYSVSKKVPIAFHNGSNYNYHFFIK